MKKFETLHAEWLAPGFARARLVDAIHDGDTTAVAQLEAARDAHGAILIELRRRDPSFDRWEC